MAQYLSKVGRFSEAQARSVFSQLLDAVRYLHDRQILHRDLKLSNLLMDEHHSRVYLSDFGLSVQLRDPLEPHYTCVGTPNFIAPEVVEEDQAHGFPADMWSLGCILFCLLVGRSPFQGDKVSETLQNVVNQRRSAFPSNLSPEAIDLMERLLSSVRVQ